MFACSLLTVCLGLFTVLVAHHTAAFSLMIADVLHGVTSVQHTFGEELINIFPSGICIL